MNIPSNPFSSFVSAVLMTALLSSCGSYEESEIVKSPNDLMAAKLFVKDGGAAIASRVYIELLLPNDQGVERIFEGTGGWPLEVKWLDESHLLIKYCGGKKIEYAPATYYEANGVPSEARAIIVTESTYSTGLEKFGLRPCVDN